VSDKELCVQSRTPNVPASIRASPASSFPEPLHDPANRLLAQTVCSRKLTHEQDTLTTSQNIKINLQASFLRYPLFVLPAGIIVSLLIEPSVFIYLIA